MATPTGRDDHAERRIGGAVLAAGAGTRLGRAKGVITVGGVRLVDRAVDVLISAGCAPVLAIVRDGVDVPGARTVVNPAPERGMGSSLQLAVEAAASCAALVVLLADMPGVDAAAVRAVVSAWRPGRVAVATYDGRRSHPTVMAPADWRTALAEAGPDEGARRHLAAHPDLVDEVPVAGDPGDIDTPEALRRWESAVAATSETHLEVLVQGRVQGVGFRYWTRAQARELGLRGSATNLLDGRVRVVAEGPAPACDTLRAAVTGETTPGVVLDAVVTTRPVDPAALEPDGFRVR